ncbi:MAG: YdeI/OmpD-associated family protein [Deltaproteobacteria bacterium]
MKSNLDETKLLYVMDRKEWRAWLTKHHKSDRDVWLVYYKKHTGKPRIPYNDAVEEALCFGWIDSTARSIDGDRFAQRFTPRRPGSPYSQANKERLRKLVKEGKVIKDVLSALGNVLDEPFAVPPDILAAVKADQNAWRNFESFSPAYIRMRIAYIDGARKRPAEFEKRLRHFIAMTGKNRLFGFGGIEKYY